MAECVLQTGKEGAERLDALESMFGTASRSPSTPVGSTVVGGRLPLGCR